MPGIVDRFKIIGRFLSSEFMLHVGAAGFAVIGLGLIVDNFPPDFFVVQRRVAPADTWGVLFMAVSVGVIAAHHLYPQILQWIWWGAFVLLTVWCTAWIFAFLLDAIVALPTMGAFFLVWGFTLERSQHGSQSRHTQEGQ